jgi:hypothetical protein
MACGLLALLTASAFTPFAHAAALVASGSVIVLALLTRKQLINISRTTSLSPSSDLSEVVDDEEDPEQQQQQQQQHTENCDDTGADEFIDVYVSVTNPVDGTIKLVPSRQKMSACFCDTLSDRTASVDYFDAGNLADTDVPVAPLPFTRHSRKPSSGLSIAGSTFAGSISRFLDLSTSAHSSSTSPPHFCGYSGTSKLHKFPPDVIDSKRASSDENGGTVFQFAMDKVER